MLVHVENAKKAGVEDAAIQLFHDKISNRLKEVVRHPSLAGLSPQQITDILHANIIPDVPPLIHTAMVGMPFFTNVVSVEDVAAALPPVPAAENAAPKP
jgi:hypothetical protein